MLVRVDGSPPYECDSLSITDDYVHLHQAPDAATRVPPKSIMVQWVHDVDVYRT